ncbi:MAG TPA: hypothetical protein EYP67_06560 [Methanosarcinales archaeon]|nr:hypothetical protein [Methanosarcinales archaeon]
MRNSKKGTAFLVEFRDFIAFLQSLWGILAGISVLFPLSNVLIKLIPLRRLHDDPAGALGYLTPDLITVVATLITLFVVLLTFSNRHKFEALKERRLIQRQACFSFAFGLLALIIYFTVYFGIYPLYYEPYGIYYGDPRWLIGDFGLLLSYSTFFALVSRAFMLLGMIEYFGKS